MHMSKNPNMEQNNQSNYGYNGQNINSSNVQDTGIPNLSKQYTHNIQNQNQNQNGYQQHHVNNFSNQNMYQQNNFNNQSNEYGYTQPTRLSGNGVYQEYVNNSYQNQNGYEFTPQKSVKRHKTLIISIITIVIIAILSLLAVLLIGLVKEISADYTKISDYESFVKVVESYKNGDTEEISAYDVEHALSDRYIGSDYMEYVEGGAIASFDDYSETAMYIINFDTSSHCKSAFKSSKNLLGAYYESYDGKVKSTTSTGSKLTYYLKSDSTYFVVLRNEESMLIIIADTDGNFSKSKIDRFVDKLKD